MSEHTPGPWRAEAFGVGCMDIWGPNREEIAAVHDNDGGDDPEFYPAVANAHLIAAAPDLLAVVREYYEAYNGAEYAEGGWPLMDHARAALIKAEGQ